MPKIFRITAVLFVAFSANILFGQDTSMMFRMDADDLAGEVNTGRKKVVAASRSASFIEDLPVTVYVVTREEILANGYTTLADVLKSVPGVRVSQPGSAVEGEQFMIRGLKGNYYTKILVDDVPIQPSVVSGMPIGEQLPVRQAERIEILVGPAGAIYGADALAGVINIVTMKSERPVYAHADISVGSLGYEGLSVTIGGRTGKAKNILGYRIFGSYGNRDDMNIKYDIENVYNPALYDTTLSYLASPYYKGDTFAPEFGRLPSQSRLIGFGLNFRGLRFDGIFMNRSMHSSIGQETADFYYYDPENKWGEDIQRVTLGYDVSSEKLSSTTNISYLRYRLNERSSFGINANVGMSGRSFKYAASDDLFLEEVLTWSPVNGLDLTGGFNFQYSGNLPVTNDLAEPFDPDLYDIFSEDLTIPDNPLGEFGFNPLVFSNTAGYLQAFLRFEKLNILAGGRYDHHSIYGSSLNPRVALLYKIRENLTVRGSYNSGLRTPSNYFAYNARAFKVDEGILYNTVPNPDLDPEKLQYGEAGLRYDPFDWLSFDLTFFYQKLKNQFTLSIALLDTVLYPGGVPDRFLVNSYINDDKSSAEIYGLNFLATAKDLFSPLNLDVDFYLSLSEGNEILPSNLGTLDEVRQVPRYMGQLNFTVKPWRKVHLFLRNSFSDQWVRGYLPLPPDIMERLGQQVRIDGYYTMDLLIRVNISRNFQAYFDLSNVLNSKYGGLDAYGNALDLVYNPQYGRNFRFGLVFDLE